MPDNALFTLMTACRMISSSQSCLLFAYKHDFSAQHKNQSKMGTGTKKGAMRYPTLLPDEARTAITQGGYLGNRWAEVSRFDVLDTPPLSETFCVCLRHAEFVGFCVHLKSKT